MQTGMFTPEEVEKWLNKPSTNLDKKSKAAIAHRAREISGRNGGASLTKGQITGAVFQGYPGASRRFLDAHPERDVRFKTADLAPAYR